MSNTITDTKKRSGTEPGDLQKCGDGGCDTVDACWFLLLWEKHGNFDIVFLDNTDFDWISALVDDSSYLLDETALEDASMCSHSDEMQPDYAATYKASSTTTSNQPAGCEMCSNYEMQLQRLQVLIIKKFGLLKTELGVM